MLSTAAPIHDPDVSPAPPTTAPRLLVVPALQAYREPGGATQLTRKFIEGLEAYAQEWPGPVDVLMEPAAAPSANLDNERLDERRARFKLHVHPLDGAEARALVESAGVLMSTAHYRQAHLPTWCRAAGVPFVLHTELSLSTRSQIARAEPAPWWRVLRRLQWEWLEERRLRRVVREADAVQCAGTPTYEAYRPLNPRALLYHDSRTRADMVISEPALRHRLAHLQGEPRGPLRLVFTGRLAPIKGVQHLPAIASRLAALGVSFQMDVFGDGPLRPALQRDVDRLGLGSVVRLQGAIDYATELVPRVSSGADLFVCTHLQGDPSCTYLETLACGVPIAGTANEAWAGMLRHGVDGWAVEVGRWEALADQIARLDRDREQLARAAWAARAFALEHTAELTFRRRVDHLRGLIADRVLAPA